ncbi:MAG: D-glycerate dehydrogenase [Phycisphaeraceae bacterium]|nr:MAG: D-glycerate dehydrogenase [Phycisphaeraceae bacterium]
MPRVVITRETPGEYAVPGAEIIIGPDEGYLDQQKLRAFVASHAPVTALVTMYHDQVNDELLDAAGPALRAVCNFAVGHDNIDLEACARRNVMVTNTPDAVTEGTADMAWALLLAAARRIPEADRYARSPDYPARGQLGMSDLLGLDIAGRTLLIVGAGRIGYAVALRSLGWGMRILYVARTRHHDFEFAPLNAHKVELDEGLAEADYISIHTPLTKETRRLIDARRLRLMKPRAILINTARGPIIDEKALVEALREHRIRAAGLDVYENEPTLTPGLADLPNVVLSPHIGSGGERYREMMAAIVVDNLRAVVEGTRPPNLVDTE